MNRDDFTQREQLIIVDFLIFTLFNDKDVCEEIDLLLLTH